METLLEAIRAATTPEATDEARAARANACRTILTALETKTGEAMSASVANPSLESIATALRGMSVDQLLDVAIERLRALNVAKPGPPLPAPPPRGLAFSLVPIPPTMNKRGG